MTTRYPRSCYDRTGGLVYFARMLDKIRLLAAGALPKDYHENLGGGFDVRCCTFLGVKYEGLRTEVLKGGTDDEMLQWCFSHGTPRTDDEITDWNEFMWKRGWRDGATPRLRMRVKDGGFESHQPPIRTFFDFIEADEKRTPPTLD